MAPVQLLPGVLRPMFPEASLTEHRPPRHWLPYESILGLSVPGH